MNTCNCFYTKIPLFRNDLNQPTVSQIIYVRFVQMNLENALLFWTFNFHYDWYFFSKDSMTHQSINSTVNHISDFKERCIRSLFLKIKETDFYKYIMDTFGKVNSLETRKNLVPFIGDIRKTGKILRRYFTDADEIHWKCL